MAEQAVIYRTRKYMGTSFPWECAAAAYELRVGWQQSLLHCSCRTRNNSSVTIYCFIFGARQRRQRWKERRSWFRASCFTIELCIEGYYYYCCTYVHQKRCVRPSKGGSRHMHTFLPTYTLLCPRRSVSIGCRVPKTLLYR